VVIITSDHGEAFGDHGFYGHADSAFVDEVGVPMVILAPAAPAGRLVGSPVSLRDLPATVVDEAGVATGSPFPGRSLAAYWGLAPGPVPSGLTTPALAEQAGPAAFRPRSRVHAAYGGFQMSLLASGRHYLRDGTGVERLYDLKQDPLELANLMGSPAGRQAVGDFRKMLLEFLAENPGSTEVEGAYLESYRKGLEALVTDDPRRQVAVRP
jgi:arylsulfatase A-like enzyme